MPKQGLAEDWKKQAASPNHRERSTLLDFLFLTLGHKSDALLFGELDLKLITRLEVQQSGLCLAHQEVAIALHNGLVGKLSAPLTNAATRANTDTLGFQECLIKSSEVQAIRPIFLLRDIAASLDNFGLASPSHLFDFGKELFAGKHGY